MMKLIAFAALAAVTFAVAGAPVRAETAGNNTAIVMADHTMRASKLIGLAVNDDHGQKLGTIVDILVKSGASEPIVILTTGSKLVSAPISHISIEKATVMMPGTTPAMIAAMPVYSFNPLAGGGG